MKTKSNQESSASHSIGIAGAGIIGRLIAWRLAEEGYQVTLFDKDPVESGDAAAFTAAGMLTPYSEIETAEMPIHTMGIESLTLWPQYSRRLDFDFEFVKNGTLVVAHPEDKVELKRFKQSVFNHLLSTHESAKHLLFELSQKDLAVKEPELTCRFSEATYIENEASLSPEKVMQALARALSKQGVRWLPNTFVTSVSAQKIIYKSNQNGLLVQESETLIDSNFDFVIDTRGMGANGFIPELRGVRGELIWVSAPEVSLNHMIRLLHPRYRLYIVPKKQNIYIIGATQIESNDQSEISVRSALELLSALYSVHPGFAEAKILDMKTNCRPALPDNLPKIQNINGVISVNGLFRHGYLLSPYLAEKIVDLFATKVDSPERQICHNLTNSSALA
jgi:glycine oxidase